MDAANAAFQVGYESPSQFSREYSRVFGAPPLRDITNLRQIAGATIRDPLVSAVGPFTSKKVPASAEIPIAIVMVSKGKNQCRANRCLHDGRV